MPAKHTVKLYVENGYYHIYNRGVEKRQIFLDEQDCRVFLRYLKLYLSPVADLEKQSFENLRISRFISLNLFNEIDLLAFALMPNHIHLLVKQKTKDGIVKLMRRVATSYVTYFNKKYKRVGSLFQSIYKAVLIDSDNYLLHLSRYIHLNPSTLNLEINFLNYSSYPYYLEEKHANWIKPEEILSYFRNEQKQWIKNTFSYKSFVKDFKDNVDIGERLGDLVLEDQ